MRSVLNLIDEFLIASIEEKGVRGGKIGVGRTYFFLTSFNAGFGCDQVVHNVLFIFIYFIYSYFFFVIR